MGRKVFQPEIRSIADELGRRAVDVFKSYLALMREDTGAPNARASNELFNFKITQRDHRRDNPLVILSDFENISILSEPQKEQDVVALFHEIIGSGLLKGYGFFATSEHERYDSVFVANAAKDHVYRRSNQLGVRSDDCGIGENEPKILEYKYDFDGFIADIESEKKFVKDVDLVVCWSIGRTYRDSFNISSFLWGDQGSDRSFYGSTHALYREREKILEIICLSDLLRFIRDPNAVSGEQKIRYQN